MSEFCLSAASATSSAARPTAIGSGLPSVTPKTTELCRHTLKRYRLPVLDELAVTEYTHDGQRGERLLSKMYRLAETWELVPPRLTPS